MVVAGRDVTTGVVAQVRLVTPRVALLSTSDAETAIRYHGGAMAPLRATVALTPSGVHILQGFSSRVGQYLTPHQAQCRASRFATTLRPHRVCFRGADDHLTVARAVSLITPRTQAARPRPQPPLRPVPRRRPARVLTRHRRRRRRRGAALGARPADPVFRRSARRAQPRRRRHRTPRWMGPALAVRHAPPPSPRHAPPPSPRPVPPPSARVAGTSSPPHASSTRPSPMPPSTCCGTWTPRPRRSRSSGQSSSTLSRRC